MVTLRPRPYIINAILLKNIEYEKNGIPVVIPFGTSVIVDMNKGICLYEGDQVMIWEDEYEWIAEPVNAIAC